MFESINHNYAHIENTWYKSEIEKWPRSYFKWILNFSHNSFIWETVFVVHSIAYEYSFKLCNVRKYTFFLLPYKYILMISYAVSLLLLVMFTFCKSNKPFVFVKKLLNICKWAYFFRTKKRRAVYNTQICKEFRSVCVIVKFVWRASDDECVNK